MRNFVNGECKTCSVCVIGLVLRFNSIINRKGFKPNSNNLWPHRMNWVTGCFAHYHHVQDLNIPESKNSKSMVWAFSFSIFYPNEIEKPIISLQFCIKGYVLWLFYLFKHTFITSVGVVLCVVVRNFLGIAMFSPNWNTCSCKEKGGSWASGGKTKSNVPENRNVMFLRVPTQQYKKE